MESIIVNINNIDYIFEKGTTVSEAFEKALPYYTKTIFAAFCKGGVIELNEPLIADCTLHPVDYDSQEGKRIYERSLSLLVIAALKNLYPTKHAEIQDAVGKSLNIIMTDKTLSHCDVQAIEQEMRRLVDAKLDIKKYKWSVEEAIKFYRRTDQMDKVELLSYRRTPTITIYNLENSYDYFYGAMLPNTEFLSAFKLKARYPGMLINYPEDSSMEVTEETISHKKQYRVFDESQRWCDILNVSTVADVNKMIENGKIREFIRVNEALHDNSIAHIAKEVISNNARIVLIFGPSCSGKTTFTHRLDVHLKVHGLQPVIISLDDFYKDRDTLPRLENGEIDLETIDALDLDTMINCFDGLLSGEEVTIPIFDFKDGKRKPVGRTVRIKEDQPILVEGIHAMNDRITSRLPEHLTYGIYVSPLTCLKLDDHNRMHTSDARLLRRIVRDMQFRGTSVNDTINMWKSVREGEIKWIYPYQEKADIMFNTTLHYELPLLHSFIYSHLDKIGIDDKNYISARRIVKSLNYFLPIGSEVIQEIPPLSILREFIGGCSFYIRD